jgi:hypothetical protein
LYYTILSHAYEYHGRLKKKTYRLSRYRREWYEEAFNHSAGWS